MNPPRAFVLLACLALFAAGPTMVRADVPSTLGGGNIGRRLESARLMFKALNDAGAGMCRIPVAPGDYGLETGQPRPERLDELMLLAHEHRIEPILLFEYYTRWHKELKGRERWHAIGRAYAGRFSPGSAWLKSKGIEKWGVRYYSAINEPTWRSNNPTPIPPEDYAAALEGLADGVHEVSGSLRVNPGGWIEGSLRRGDHAYSKAVARLFNKGKLHAIGIHRYWDVEYVPMQGRYDWSLQSQFEEVKRKTGITADVAFYTDEINFKKRKITEEEAAKGFLSALWDGLGVVGNRGQRVTEFIMPWNIFHETTRDENYGMCTRLDPWTPVARGKVLRSVCSLTRGMDFVSCEPKGRGMFVLAGGGRKLWVWQNRKAWTDKPGTRFTIDGIPPDAKKLGIYGWDGLRRTEDLKGGETHLVQGLKTGETYMFLATRGGK